MKVKTTNNLQTLLALHLAWYPLMELQDIYKLLYQGEMGAGHLVRSAEDYSQGLYNEFNPLLPDSSERMTEPVQRDHTLYRLNLRAWKARYDNLELLLPYLLETAGENTGSLPGLQSTWHEFLDLCASEIIPNFKQHDVDDFTGWLDVNGYPGIHHSKIYQSTYHPAYRLISSVHLSQLRLYDAS